MGERPPIVFYAFDLLRLNGKDLQDLPIEERKSKLEELLKKPPGVIRFFSLLYKRHYGASEPDSQTRAWGLIGKRAGSRYEAGKRSGSVDQG